MPVPTEHTDYIEERVFRSLTIAEQSDSASSVYSVGQFSAH